MSRTGRVPSLVVVALVGRFVNGVQLGLGTWLALVGVLWAGSVAG
jgi:ABC-2 type transport system permease protein